MSIDISEDITLAFIVAILGIAFPIIIQTISGIDTKYGSTRLVKRITRSWQFIFFCITLGIAIITRIYYCFAPPLKIDCGKWNYLAENSAIIISICATTTLIISLFLFIFTIIRYYYPVSLLNGISKRLRSCTRKTPSREERELKDWNDLTIYLINSENDNTSREAILQTYSILHQYVLSYSKGMAYKVIIFPHFFYDTITSVNRAICHQERQLSSIHNSNIITQIFIDDFLRTRISEDTFLCIWMCLSEQIFKNREDLIFQYWVWVYQHFNLVLSHRLYEGDIENKGFVNIQHVVTKKDVQNREHDRWEFTMFNIALCSQLLYKGHYHLLHDILAYTNNTFSLSNTLIPDDYFRILQILIRINNINYNDIVWLERKYPFMDLRGGVFTNDLIKSWIEKFLSILLLRSEYNHENSHHTDLPQIPTTIAEKNVLLKNIESILRTTQDGLQKIDIDNIFENLSNKRDVVIDKLNNYKQELLDEIDKQEKEQMPAEESVSKFFATIRSAVDDFKNILLSICGSDKHTGPNTSTEECNQIGIFYHQIESKSIFCENQGFSIGNFFDALKQEISFNLHINFGKALLKYTVANVICFRTDIIHILDQLKLNKNHLVILSSYDYDSWFNEIKDNITNVNNDFEFSYNGNRIFKLNLLMQTSCMWIINSDDISGFQFNNEPLQTKFIGDVKALDEGVFANVIDLYNSPDVLEKIKSNNTNKSVDYEKSVLELCDINMSLCIKKDTKILQVILTDQWSNIPYTDWPKVKPLNEYLS